jgi:WD40 repeat protein
LVRFAADLRDLREKAGSPTYRELSGQAHFSATALSSAAAGRKLPSLPVTLAYVRACGGDPTEWDQRWHDLAAETAAADREDRPAETAAGSPYVGLASFRSEDAHRFFGRDRLVDAVTARLSSRRFVVVSGTSGAGKSSSLRAGVLPRMRADGWRTVLFTPGARPLEECAIHLGRLDGRTADPLTADLAGDPRALHRSIRQALAEQPPEVELLLVVDQFEELFTLCHDEAERNHFIDALLVAAQAENSRCRVVLGVRADFYGHCASHPGVAALLADAHVPIDPMTTEELRQAITEPAVQTGCAVEGALLARIVGDVAGQVGTLPLVSHALLETWRRRRGNTLTVHGYEMAGGIRGAVAQTAEHAYTALGARGRERARQILLRLVALGEGTEDTKRRVRRSELDDDPETTAALAALVDARLVTVDRDGVELAHEALVRSWPRLRAWLAEDRDGLRVHRRLTEATRTWVSLDRDPGALYRGVSLEVARDWALRHGRSLTVVESAFLRTSLATDQREQAVRQRRTRQLRWLASALAVLLVAAVAVTAVAVRQRQDAIDEGLVTASRQLAAEAMAEADWDVAAAMRRALDAYRSHPTVEARSAVLSIASWHHYAARLPGPVGIATETAFSPDGRVLAAPGAAGRIGLWDVASRTESTVLSGQFGQVLTVAFSPDGRRLAHGGQDGGIKIWDVAGRSVLVDGVTAGGAVAKIRFSADGRLLATAGDTGVRLWDAADGKPLATFVDHGPSDVAFSPDGRLLAFTDTAGGITLWNLATSAVVDRIATDGIGPRSVAFSPDGGTIATAGTGRVVRLWDAATRRHVVDLQHVDSVRQVVFDQAGDRLLALDIGGDALLWDVPRHALIGQLVKSKSSNLANATFSPDGRFIAGSGGYGSTIGSILLWDREDLPFVGHVDTASGVALSPDDTTLVSSSADGTLILWDREHRTQRAVVVGSGSSSLDTRGPVVSPDGRLLVAGHHGETTIRDAKTLRALAVVAPGSAVGRGVFSPDSRTLAVLADDRTVTLWDVTGTQRASRAVEGESALDIGYSPDGSLLAVATSKGRVLLRDATTLESRGTLTVGDGPVGTVTFNPDGTLLATTGTESRAGQAEVWNVDTHDRVGVLTNGTTPIHWLTFSPDGRLIATFGEDAAVALWDTDGYDRWAVLSGHSAAVTDLSWSPDGTTVASSSRDRTVIAWNTDVDRAIGRLCHALAHDFPDSKARPATCADRE